jgi:hypothetical protein
MGFQMKRDPLPGKDHISRYCAPKTAPAGRPTGASFMLRKGEEFLSVNWMEHFGETDQKAQIAKIREHIELSLAKYGLFAVLNVGRVIDHIQRFGEKKDCYFTSANTGRSIPQWRPGLSA